MKRLLGTVFLINALLMALPAVSRAQAVQPVPEASAEFATLNGIAGYMEDRSYRAANENVFVNQLADLLSRQPSTRRALLAALDSDPLRTGYGLAFQVQSGKRNSVYSTQVFLGSGRYGIDGGVQYSISRDFEAAVYSLGVDVSPARRAMVRDLLAARSAAVKEDPGRSIFGVSAMSASEAAAGAIVHYARQPHLAVLGDYQDIQERHAGRATARFGNAGGSVSQLFSPGRDKGVLALVTVRELFYSLPDGRRGEVPRYGAVLAWQDHAPRVTEQKKIAPDYLPAISADSPENAITLYGVTRWTCQVGAEYVWKTSLDEGDKVGAFLRLRPALHLHSNQLRPGPLTEYALTATCIAHQQVKDTGTVGVRVSTLF